MDAMRARPESTEEKTEERTCYDEGKGVAIMVDFIRRLFSGKQRDQQTAREPEPVLEPVRPKVLMIVNDPPIASEGNRRLTEIFGWQSPDALARGYIDDLRACSGGYLHYEIVDRIIDDEFPVKEDGFRYDGDSYLTAWKEKKHHEPDRIDYPAQIAKHQLEHRHRMGEFDEVWFFSFPFAGHYESTMAGPGAFWCNSPPVQGTERMPRRFVMMGFSYERGIGEMLENFGHRSESIMKHVYEIRGTGRNMWDLFKQYDKTHPGEAQVGLMHFAPNSVQDYDWGNTTPVTSYCDDWLTYPALPGKARTVTCADWGDGDIRRHHIWWFQHLPKAPGETDDVSNNWWRYIVDPNQVQ
jgi:hypothetical protein